MFDIAGIGNVLLDTLGSVSEQQLRILDYVKGTRRLVGTTEADIFQNCLVDVTSMAGGSVANTLVWMGAHGRKALMVGAVGSDNEAVLFANSLSEHSVELSARRIAGRTGRCVVGITSDGERTMATDIGAANDVGPGIAELLRQKPAKLVYIEGYLFDSPEFRQYLDEIVCAAQVAGSEIALTLSDEKCVERHRQTLRYFAEKHVDILIGNAKEFAQFFGVADPLNVAAPCPLAVMSDGQNAPIVFRPRHPPMIGPKPEKIVVSDTTGAGDAFAAGFLLGHLSGEAPSDAMHLGNTFAARVIVQIGARPN